MNNASNLYLYQREGGYLPRVAAVHDLCGYGKCSLGIAIPVLSAAGIDVCPVPTSLFSAHTRFPKFYMHDTTTSTPGARRASSLTASTRGFWARPSRSTPSCGSIASTPARCASLTR